MNRLRRLLPTLTLITSVVNAAPYLVKDGKPAASIVLNDKPTQSAQLAAKELQYHIKLITGAELKIVNGKAAGNLYPVYLGKSAAAEKMGLTNEAFKSQEYAVKIMDSHAVMVGRDAPDYGAITYEKTGAWRGMNFQSPTFQVGTLYAVYDFLERQCGVRWYMVSELGTSYPQTTTLEIKPDDRRHRPWGLIRVIGNGTWAKPGSFGTPDLMGYIRNSNYTSGRDNTLYKLRVRFHGGEFPKTAHTLHAYNKIYGKAHPDWFVGSSPGNNIQLRYWKDEVVNEVAKNAIDYFSAYDAGSVKPGNPKYSGGHGNVFALGPCDNRIFGEDALPPKQPDRMGGFADGQYSNYWFTFVNRVASKVRQVHPDKWIGSPAYASHFEAPDFELEPNVGIYMANTEGWTENSYGIRTLREWRKKAKRVFVYDYWYSKGRFPAVRPRKVAAYLDMQSKVGAEGMFMEMIGNSNPVAYHMDYYVSMRKLFDNTASVDGLLEEYFQLFYGPAENPMRTFWLNMEEYGKTFEDLGVRNDLWYVVSKTNIMHKLEAQLAKAEAAATEEPYASRVRIIRTGVFDMMQDRIKFARMVNDARIPEVEVTKTDKKPFLDGKLDDEIWKDAVEVGAFFRQVGGHGWRTPLTQRVMEACPDTKVKLAWDGDHLYLGFLLLEDKMEKQKLDQKHSSSGICTDDSLDILIDVGRRRNKKDYTQIMINALGVMWHQWTRYGWCKPVPVDLGYQGKAWRGDDRWTAEIIVPLNATLTDGNPPKPGDTWGLNILRNRFSGTNRAFWSKPFTGSFHNMERFGLLHFAE